MLFVHQTLVNHILNLEITPAIIRSETPLKPNEWTEISVGRSKNGVGFLQVGNGAEISEPRLTARAQSIFLKTPLYIGGYDKRILLNQGLEVSRGFDGCITGVRYFYCFDSIRYIIQPLLHFIIA